MLRSDSVAELDRAGLKTDAAAEDETEPAEQRNGEQERRRDRPVDLVGVDHHEDQADDRGEDHIDERRDELLGVGPDLLELAEGLAAALVLEDLEWQGQRVPNSVGVELCAQPLRYNVYEVVLEVLGHAGDERDTNGHREEERDSAKELSVGELVVLGGVVVDDVAEDQRIKQRKDLIERREDESERDHRRVRAQITGEKPHDRNIDQWEGSRRRGRARFCRSA